MGLTRPTIVFDVNETLLDLGALDAPFAEIFGKPQARTDWFKQVLQLALLANVLADYADFSMLGRRALVIVAQQYGRELSEADTQRIADAIRSLPPHSDVVPSLTRLREAGFRIVTLTNSPPPVLAAQIERAGLRSYFDALLSVDAVHEYKPAPSTYRYAATTLGIPIENLLLVAAHGWDVAGAMRAGAQAAFVARPGQVLIPDEPIPAIVAPSLAGVVDRLIQRFV